MNWQAVLDNPYLKDLPFKFETNRWGKIVMSPASNEHSHRQATIAAKIIAAKLNGRIFTECSVETADGVKVADVAWASEEFIERHGFETPYRVAPEICVEIISPSNSLVEMEEKTQLYLAKGAKEVWICSLDGTTRYYSHEGQIEKSQQVPGMD